MKNRFFILLTCALAMVACNNEPKDEPQSRQSTTFTCSIGEGEEVIAYNLTEITLTFYRPATIQKAELITLNNQTISAAVNQSNKAVVVLSLPTLAEGTSYTLHIGAGAITVNYSETDIRPNQEMTVHFKTKESAITHIDTTLCNADAIASAMKVNQY